MVDLSDVIGKAVGGERGELLNKIIDTYRIIVNNTTVWGERYDDTDLISDVILNSVLADYPEFASAYNRFVEHGEAIMQIHFPTDILKEIYSFLESKIRPQYEMR